MEILKTRIAQFYWRVEWEFSTRDCLTGISSLYEEVLIDMNHMIMEDMEEETDWEETDWEEINDLFKTVRKIKSENMEVFKEKHGNQKTAEEEMRSSHKEGEKGLKRSKCMYEVAIKNKNQKKKALVKLRKHEKECKEEKKLDDKTEESGEIFGGTTIQVEETIVKTIYGTDSQTSDTSDLGSLLNDNGEGGRVLYWQFPGGHKTDCALCGTSFDPTEYDEIYCPKGCPDEALEKLDDKRI